MKLLSLDLEMNQPSGKTIQIGACVFCHKEKKIVDKFMIYVNPQEVLAPRIIELTGIQQHKVENEGYPVKEAYFLLKKFAEKNKCFRNPIVWGSGVWNDSHHLYNEAKPDEPNFMGHRVLDAKTLYQSLRIITWKKVKGGLNIAMEEMGLKFEGKNHDALDDAINTAKIWMHLTDLLKSGLKAQNQQVP